MIVIIESTRTSILNGGGLSRSAMMCLCERCNLSHGHITQVLYLNKNRNYLSSNNIRIRTQVILEEIVNFPQNAELMSGVCPV